MQVIASSAKVATDRSYPIGEHRYLSYCAKTATCMSGPWREGRDPGVTEMFFGEQEPFGPLPFNPQALDRTDLAARILQCLWEAFGRSLLPRILRSPSMPRSSLSQSDRSSTQRFHSA